MSDDVIYKRCNRCATMMSFPKPQVILLPDEDKPEELLDWERIRDGGTVAHAAGQCPNEIEAAAEAAIGKHAYRVELRLFRDGEEIARQAGERDGVVTFKEAADSLSSEMDAKWRQLVSMAGIIDSDLQGGDDDDEAAPDPA